ncbi:MAG: hypothetical protein AB8H47_20710 [Bacteroidia bacterium]
MRKIALFTLAFCAYYFCLAQEPDWYFTFGAPNSYSSIFDLQIDENGNIYALAMIFPETDVDPGPDELILAASNYSSRALLKYRSDGSLIWGKSLGNFNGKLRINHKGEIILGGVFSKEIQFGDQTFNPIGGYDHFLAKLSSSGEFIWAISMGSEQDESLFDLEVDSEGNILMYGDYMGEMDVDPGEETHQINNQGYRDVLLASYSTDGKFNWECHFGSSQNEFPTSLTLDQQGDIHITGTFLSSFKVQTPVGEKNVKKLGWSNMYWACIDQSGQVQWIKSLGGAGYIGGGFLEEAQDGSFWLLTGINNEVDIAFGDTQKIIKSTTEDVSDMVLAHYDAEQNLLATRQFKSKSYAEIADFHLTADGRMYISGNFRANLGIDWDSNMPQMTADTLWDGFVVGIMPEDQSVFWSKHLTGPQGEGLNVVREDQEGNIYLGGSYMDNSRFDPRGINLELSSKGIYEAILMRFPAVIPQGKKRTKRPKRTKKQ